MGISRRRLDHDESVVLSTRTHGKALLRPLLALMAIAAVAGLAVSFTPSAGRAAPLLQVVIWGIAALGAGRWVGRPFLAWLTTTYTVTDRRVISRSGIMSRRGRTLPLDRVDDVSYQRGPADRLLGSGTLVLAVTGERRFELRDVPHVERLHLQVRELVTGQVPTRVVERRATGER